MPEEKHQNEAEEAVVRFGFEWDQLRLTRRSGWHHINENPESVSNHVGRVAVIAYLLARLENHPHPDQVATRALFHDAHETRVGDLDLLQKAYVKGVDKAQAMLDITCDLGEVGADIRKMWEEVEHTSTLAGQIAKDADILEQALTARQLVVDGNSEAQAWIDHHRGRIQTESGKRLLEIINTADPSEWWKKKFYSE